MNINEFIDTLEEQVQGKYGVRVHDKRLEFVTWHYDLDTICDIINRYGIIRAEKRGDLIIILSDRKVNCKDTPFIMKETNNLIELIIPSKENFDTFRAIKGFTMRTIDSFGHMHKITMAKQ